MRRRPPGAILTDGVSVSRVTDDSAASIDRVAAGARAPAEFPPVENSGAGLLRLNGYPRSVIIAMGEATRAHPVNLIDEDGTVLVTSPDFPELTTFGADQAEALAYAVAVFEEANRMGIHARMDVLRGPTPTESDACTSQRSRSRR